MNWKGILKLRPNGTENTGFNIGSALDEQTFAAAPVDGGRLLVIGGYQNGPKLLNSDGSQTVWTMAATGGGMRGLIKQTDGKFILVGLFTSLDGTPRLRIARLRSDLTLEASFSPAANATVHALALDTAGKIYVAGAFTEVTGITRNGVARLMNTAATQALELLSSSTVRWLRNGGTGEATRVVFEIDTGTGYGAIGGTLARITGGWQVTGLALSGAGSIRARASLTDGHDGSIMEETLAFDFSPRLAVSINDTPVANDATFICGDTRHGRSRDFQVTLLNAGLSVLTLAATPVTKTGAAAADFAIVAQPASPIAAGQSVSFVLRFTPSSVGNKVAKIIITSDDPASPYEINLTATASAGTGSVDTVFDPVTTGFVTTSVVCATADRVHVGGSFTTMNSVNRGRWAMLALNSDLILQSGVGANDNVNAATQLLSGQWLIGGKFTKYNGVTKTRLARVNPDGSLDGAFSIAVNGEVLALALEPGGSVLIAGDFTTVGGLPRLGMARLVMAGNGYVDPSFNPSLGAVQCLVVQPDGKILFSHVNAGRQLWRLLSTGTLDHTFEGPPVLGPGAQAIGLQADGKILIHNSYGTAPTGLIRLTDTGAVDDTWTAPARTSKAIVIQADGRVLAADYYGAVPVRRYHPDGSHDTTFADFAASVLTMMLQMDGRLLLGGYPNIGGTGYSIVRLLNDEVTDALTCTLNRVQWQRGGCLQEASWVVFEYSQNGGASWTSLGAGVRIPGGWEKAGISLPNSGQLRGRAYCGGALQEKAINFAALGVPDIEITHSGGTTVDDGVLSIPGAQVGQASTITLTILNSGTAPLTGLTPTFYSSEFDVTSMGTPPVPALGSITMEVRFRPAAVGERSGRLDIASNVPGGKNPFTIFLRGNGVTSPAATTTSATLITNSAARLRGSVKANHDAGNAKAFVEYKRKADSVWIRSALVDVSGFAAWPIQIDVAGLQSSTAYHYRVGVYNNVTTSAAPVYGAAVDFNTTA